MYRHSKKQGAAGLGQAIAYFTMRGHDVALPLTDSADWDLIVEIDGNLKRIQVKTSSQISARGVMIFNCDVKGGNKSGSITSKTIQEQNWDLLFLHHLVPVYQSPIPKDALATKGQVNLGGQKYNEYIINGVVDH